MKNKFYISDTHFGHAGVWERFKYPDGSPLRNFQSTEEMDEHMIAQWNSVVGEFDTVYHLGDVVINQKHLHKISRLNGKKKLIMGNHDIFGFQKYLDAGFYEICSYRVFVDEFVCSHIPIHPDCISSRFITNVTGHLHGNFINDPKYITVCVEHLDDYKPISHEDLKQRIKNNKESFDSTGSVINWPLSVGSAKPKSF